MTVNLRRCTKPGPPGKGEYRPCEWGTQTCANIACPKCGVVGLLRTHSINEQGEVSPSVVCSEQGCDFHDFIKLKGWEFGPFKSKTVDD